MTQKIWDTLFPHEKRKQACVQHRRGKESGMWCKVSETVKRQLVTNKKAGVWSALLPPWASVEVILQVLNWEIINTEHK